MKKIISLLLTAVMMLSSLTVVFAAEIPTLTLGNVDATAVEAGGYVIVPVTIDKFPEGCVNGVQLDFTFDKTKLQFSRARIKDMSGNSAMQVYFLEDPDFPDDATLVDAAWNYPKDAQLTETNENGKGSVLYVDANHTKSFTTAQSLSATDVLIYLYFTKVDGATGTTTVDLSEVGLVDLLTNSKGTEYYKSRNQINTVASTVTFTAGPTDKVETVGTTYTGDLGEVVDGDTSDVATAIYAELNGDTDTTYKKVNWTVNATIDEKAVVGTYTSDVNLSGEATYYLGMVIQGLAQDTVTAVAAALAE